MSDHQPLPPFSGENATCIKCGHAGAYTEYRNEHGWTDYGDTGQRVAIEHLHRSCVCCGYGWPEATISDTSRSEGDKHGTTH